MSKDRDPSGSVSVLMQRVIALNGVLDDANKRAKPIKGPPPLFHKQPIDLGATALEWGAQQLRAKPQIAPLTTTTVSAPAQADAPSVQDAKDSPDAQWATYSSISMRPCDDLLLSQRILGMNIDDAVTVQYNPAATELAVTSVLSSSDLASLDRALESAGVLPDNGLGLSLPIVPSPQPSEPEREREPVRVKARTFVVPAPLVWTVLGVFALCALALGYLVATFLM